MAKAIARLMSRLAICAIAANAVAEPAAGQDLEPDDEGWLSLEAVGVTFDVPAPFVSLVEEPIVFEDPRGAKIARYPSGIELVRFAVAAVDAGGESPNDVAAALHEANDTPDITYTVDRPDLGVVSGYDGAFIFYNGCKRRGGRIVCFSLTYPEQYRALVDPAVGRILRSMR